MEKRKIGKSTLEVAPWALGTNVFGWTVDEPTAYKLLDSFVEKGFNLIDTADVYSRWAHEGKGGQSETIIGNWLKKSGKRSSVVLATKVGMEMGPNEKGLSRKYITQEIEHSLRRLQTDYIDLYQSHKDDADTPIEETLSTYEDLVKQGKVRVIGASNFSAERLIESIIAGEKYGYPRYECLQPLYNLYSRKEFEADLASACQRHSLGVITYYSLASGFLTGKYRSEKDISKSARGGGMNKYMNERGFRILNALDEVSAKHNATQAQIATAWLMARPGITAPIASASKLQQLEDLAKAAEIKLNDNDMLRLNEASAWVNEKI
ncbi:MAG: aldo/keto reductase [Flavipsychrobacter sp.]